MRTRIAPHHRSRCHPFLCTSHHTRVFALSRRETTHLSRSTEGFPVESKKLARQKLFRQSKKKMKHENHAKLVPRVETFRCNSGEKFLHIQNRRNYFIFFCSSCVKNSRRDEKSLNDDWRKLHRKQKEKKREKIVFVLRGSCEYEKGVKIATYTHTRLENPENFSSTRSLMRE